MNPRWRVALTLGAALLLAASPPPPASEQLQSDEKTLEAASIPTDAPSLIAFFKKRTLASEQRTRIESLITQLGAPEYAVRQKATADLADLDGLARAHLTHALNNRDPEIRKRAREILNRIGPASSEANLLGPAARILASKRQPGAALVLLDFLPNIEDPEVAQEVAAAFPPLALDRAGKPDPVLLAALADRLPIRRQAAACAFARSAVPAHRALARKLLEDRDLGVRRRVAVSLVESGDREAVPVLIQLLTSSVPEDFNAVEETLILLAGERAPERTTEDAPNAREQYQQRWKSWWKENQAGLDLARVDFNTAYRGYTLVTTMNAARTTSGAVAELDASGKPRWKISNLNYPVHASMARRDRVLICEYYGNRVTERDLKGTVLWTKHVGNQVLSAERLPNGNTFIATRQQLIEVDRDGREVRTIIRPFDVLAAHRNKDGSFTLLTTSGNCLQLDREGKQISSFSIGYLGGVIGFRAHFLPRGGVVVPDYSRSKIREYDASGKQVWEIDAFRPSAVVKLPNGNLLYASRMRNSLVELDRNGKEISRRDLEGRPLFIDRR